MALQRYSDRERMNHWAMALLFLLAAVSGLAFFHPAFFFLVHLMGGPVWARILHPFVGLLMALSFLGLYLKLAKDNRFTEADAGWKLGDVIRGNKAALPPAGKYNRGQKIVFWVMSGSLLVMLVTGLLIWRPYFAGGVPIPALRAAVLLHSVAAVLLILSVIVHVYAALWVKGTVRAMTRGTVSEGWAKLNHPLWHREMTGGK